MYAVVMTGGKQYRVEAGSTLVVEKLAGEAGSSVTFDRVLLVGDGDSVMVGTPTVAGATVRGTVLGEELGPKIVVFKFKQKVKYRRRTGHRQHLVRVRIDAISADGKTVTAEVAEAKPKTKRSRAAAAPAEEPVAAPKPRTRRSAKPAEASKPAEEAAPASSRTRSRATSARTAAGQASAEAASKEPEAKPAAPKPRTRRSAAKAESAKEE